MGEEGKLEKEQLFPPVFFSSLIELHSLRSSHCIRYRKESGAEISEGLYLPVA